MAASREPRRIARATWEIPTHLGELDADVDELHNIRERDQSKHSDVHQEFEARHAADLGRLERKLDKLTAWAIRAVVAGFTAAVTLIANIAGRFL